MNQIKPSAVREISSGGFYSPEQLRLLRTIKIEDIGDPRSGKLFAGIRLKGRWLAQAGFRPGFRAAVIVQASGVLQLRIVPQSPPRGPDGLLVMPEQSNPCDP